MQVQRKTLTQLSIPICFETLFYMLSGMVDTLMLSSVSDQAVGAVGTANTYISVFIIMFGVISSGMVAVMTQNIGAGKHKRASQTLRYATILTTAYGIVITILMELAVQPVMQLFTPDAAVVALGCQYMRGYIIDTIFAGIHFSFSGYFAAYGKSYIGFLHNMAAIVLLRVPGSYLASRMFPETLFPMGLAAPAGSLLSVVICLGAFFWMKRRGTIECA